MSLHPCASLDMDRFHDVYHGFGFRVAYPFSWTHLQQETSYVRMFLFDVDADTKIVIQQMWNSEQSFYRCRFHTSVTQVILLLVLLNTDSRCPIVPRQPTASRALSTLLSQVSGEHIAPAIVSFCPVFRTRRFSPACSLTSNAASNCSLPISFFPTRIPVHLDRLSQSCANDTSDLAPHASFHR